MSNPTRQEAIATQGSPRRWLVRFLAGASLGLLLAACSAGSTGSNGSAGSNGSTGSNGSDGAGEQGDPAGSVPFGLPGFGGGGGTLIFDGQQIPITSATCLLQPDTFDVGTVSDNQYRVLVSLNNPANPISVQILDSKFVQWFPQGNPAKPVVRSGSTFTSDELTYVNNSDDRTATASFTIECP